MNLPPLLQQEVEKWASRQGISSEQFILTAVVDKVAALNHQPEESANAQEDSKAMCIMPPQQPKVYWKEGILVVDADLPEKCDINAFIEELREERIRDQMAL